MALSVSGDASTSRAVILAAAYCVGLGLPFVLIAGAYERWGSVSTWLRPRLRAIQIVGGLLLLTVGILLATGKFPRVASVVLAGTLIPTTAAGTDFWNEADPVKKEAQRNAFIKNVGLLGGVLLAAVDTEGKPSLAWRGRQKASAVAAALPIGAAAGSSTWEHLVERTHDGAEIVSERSADAAAKLCDTFTGSAFRELVDLLCENSNLPSSGGTFFSSTRCCAADPSVESGLAGSPAFDGQAVRRVYGANR